MSKQPIGIFDSGIGGLTVVNKLRMLLPHEHIIYVGDTKRNPYGSRTPEEILSYTRDILRFMTQQQVKLVAIGCNTVTATAYPIVRREVPYPLIGMSRGMYTAQKISTTKTVVVFATELTIANHSHRKEALRIDPQLTVIEQSCPLLAGLIERGHLQDQAIINPIREYVKPILNTMADTAIFGCTHFPFVQELFEAFSYDRLAFIDPAHEMALETLNVLKQKKLVNTDDKQGSLRLYFTAEAQRGGRLASHLIPANEFTICQLTL